MATRFGLSPATSVLDLHCQADLDNLYVVDGSFLPSIGAVNPALTIIANALRVGDGTEPALRRFRYGNRHSPHCPTSVRS